MRKLGRSLLVAALVGSLALTGTLPSQAASTCEPISKQLGNSRLGMLYAHAIDVTTGKVLVNVRSNQQTPSASVMKTIVAAAAIKYLVKVREIKQLTPYVATTTVLFDPAQPDTLILKGGGDHTLTRVPKGSYTTYYTGATSTQPAQHPAKLRNIAADVIAALPVGTKITKIVLDDTFFVGPSMNPNWPSDARTSGNAAPITGLMVDAARKNPDLTTKAYSGFRHADPTRQAGFYFRKWLGAKASGATLVKGTAPSTATVIATANSQPITNWITHAMKVSDNTETEIIARHAALEIGLPNDYRSVQKLGNRLFSSLKIDYSKLVMKDASGLAPNNRVTPLLLTSLLKATTEPNSHIATLPSFMNTSNDGGSLQGRFRAYKSKTKKWELVIPKGSIRAKTGFIPGLYSLAGIVTTPEQHTIVFAIFAKQDTAKKKTVGTGTKNAIDNVVEKLYLCGARL